MNYIFSGQKYHIYFKIISMIMLPAVPGQVLSGLLYSQKQEPAGLKRDYYIKNIIAGK